MTRTSGCWLNEGKAKTTNVCRLPFDKYGDSLVHTKMAPQPPVFFPQQCFRPFSCKWSLLKHIFDNCLPKGSLELQLFKSALRTRWQKKKRVGEGGVGSAFNFHETAIDWVPSALLRLTSKGIQEKCGKHKVILEPGVQACREPPDLWGSTCSNIARQAFVHGPTKGAVVNVWAHLHSREIPRARCASCSSLSHDFAESLTSGQTVRQSDPPKRFNWNCVSSCSP